MHEELRSKFVALWKRALELPALSELSVALVRDWTTRMGIDAREVTERDVGPFRPIRCITVLTADGTAYLPKVSAVDDPQWLVATAQRERTAKLWEKLDWFEPLWVPMGHLEELL